MRRLLTIVTVICAALCWAPAADAQERHSLRFEVFKNGALLAKPSVTVRDGVAASLALDGAFDLAFTPTRVAPDKLDVAFEIVAGGSTIRPRLTLLKSEPGTLTWKAGSAPDAFELRLTVAPQPAR